MPDEAITVGPCAFACAIASTVILATTVVHILSQSVNKTLKRSRSRWTIFAIGVFCAAFAFNCGLVWSCPSRISNGFVRVIDLVLQSTFHSIQMIDAGKDTLALMHKGHSSYAFDYVLVVGHVLYVLSPVAFLGAVASYVSRFLSLPRARFRSFSRSNTYVFSELRDQSLTLAKNIRERHQRNLRVFRDDANLVFASVSRDADDDLQIKASELGALCVEDSIDMVWRPFFGHRKLRLVFIGKDEVSNITRAASIGKTCREVAKRRVMRKRLRALLAKIMNIVERYVMRKKLRALLAKIKCPEYAGSVNQTALPSVSIYSITSLYGAESLLKIGEQDSTTDTTDGAITVRIRRIDWTRNMVESTLDEYPLFLLGYQPPVPNDGNDPHADGDPQKDAYINWQKNMFANDKRHVVIVGAGHVGMEFLRLSLSSSRFGAPNASDALGFRFDVFDNTKDPLHPGKPLARRKFEAEAPRFAKGVLANEYNTHFHLVDALDPDFANTLDTIDKKHGGITYVLVALGDDLATVKAATRIREVLERRRVRRNANKPQGQRKNAYLADPMPIILAVVSDDDLSESLAKAEDDGFEYQIRAVGSDEDMFTFDRIFGNITQPVKKEKSEYKRRSTRASNLHRKYKLFAFMRHVANDDAKEWVVDWSADLSSLAKGDACNSTSEAIVLYDKYVGDSSVVEHEWLLRMEHDRWNVYMWAEGFVQASLNEVETFFNTCQTEERHRLNGANMHPCLVPFDKLASLDKRIDAWYDEAVRSCSKEECKSLWRCKRYRKKLDDKYGKHKPFQQQDNDYLTFSDK